MVSRRWRRAAAASSKPAARSSRAVIRPWCSARMPSQTRVSSARSLERHQHAAAAPGEVADQRVDLRLGGDVDALRRLVEQQHADLARQPFGEDHLLLVAARQRRRPAARRWRGRMSSSSISSATSRSPAARSSEPPRVKPVEARQQDVVAHRQVSIEAEPPLARHHADAGADGGGRACRSAAARRRPRTRIAAPASRPNSRRSTRPVPLPSRPASPTTSLARRRIASGRSSASSSRTWPGATASGRDTRRRHGRSWPAPDRRPRTRRAGSSPRPGRRAARCSGRPAPPPRRAGARHR